MEHNTFAGSSSPPLAQAYDSGNLDAIYKAVYGHAESLLRYSGRDYSEGHVEAQDIAQDIALKVIDHLEQGLFTGNGKQFSSWVNRIIWNKRKDFYRAANRLRKTTIPLMMTAEDEDGGEEHVENPLVSRAGAFHPCSKQLPIDPSGIDPAILQVMCDEIRPRIRYSRQRAMPALSPKDQAIVAAMLDEDSPNYSEVAARVGMSAKQVENRLNTIRRRERKKREQVLAASGKHTYPALKVIRAPAGMALSQTFI